VRAGRSRNAALWLCDRGRRCLDRRRATSQPSPGQKHTQKRLPSRVTCRLGGEIVGSRLGYQIRDAFPCDRGAQRVMVDHRGAPGLCVEGGTIEASRSGYPAATQRIPAGQDVAERSMAR
jgi:hypothetical protein